MLQDYQNTSLTNIFFEKTKFMYKNSILSITHYFLSNRKWTWELKAENNEKEGVKAAPCWRNRCLQPLFYQKQRESKQRPTTRQSSESTVHTTLRVPSSQFLKERWERKLQRKRKPKKKSLGFGAFFWSFGKQGHEKNWKAKWETLQHTAQQGLTLLLVVWSPRDCLFIGNVLKDFIFI